MTTDRERAAGGDAAGLGPARAGRFAGALAALLGCAIGSPASADDAPRALVICAQCVTDADSAAEASVRAALRDTGRFELLPAPALDLEAVQLSIDCPEENAECLRQVARRLDADVLVVTRSSRERDRVKLRLLYFDARSGHEPRSAERARAFAEGSQDWSAELPQLLRELLPAPPEAKSPQAEPASTEPAEADAEREPAAARPAVTSEDGSDRPTVLPMGPILLGSGGVALIAAGLITGAIMRGTEDDYAAREVATREQAEQAEAERSRGRSQALVANVLLGTGAAAVVAAGVWLALDLRAADGAERATLTPLLGRGAAGVRVAGRWELSP